MSGWISLHRKIMDHPFYTEKRKFSRYEAWIDLIMLANHQDNKFMLGNQLIEVKRGSFITSELKLMDRWDWGKEKLRAYLRLLESDGMITKESTTKQTTITICNYEKHSSKPDRNDTSDTNGLEASADRQQTAGRPLADYEPYTNNNLNNDNKKNISPKPSKPVYDEQSIPFRLSNYLLAKIREFKPDIKEPNLQVWADDMRKIVELDKKDPKQVSEVIEWVTQDSFWQSNILSASKLRLKWDTVTAKMMQTKRYRDTEKKVVQVDFTASEEEKRHVAQAFAKQNGLQAANNE